jgi:hypothetical protein
LAVDSVRGGELGQRHLEQGEDYLVRLGAFGRCVAMLGVKLGEVLLG